LDNFSELQGRDRDRALLLLAKLETGIDKSKEIYRRIINSGSPTERLKAKLELAKIYYSLSDYNKVKEILHIIPERAERHDILESHFYLGMSWKELSGVENARYNFSKIDRGPFLYWSYIYLGELDMQEGKIESAAERYESIASEHYNPIAGFKLGECYEIMGQSSKAMEVYRTLISNFPRAAETPKAREKIQMLKYAKDKDWQTTEDQSVINETDEEEPSYENRQTASPSFTIQLGAFKLRENAIKLSSELGEHFEDIRIERVVADGEIWHRVRIGKFSERELAEKESKRIMREFGYSGKVIPIEKNDH
jgi:tetratricopeptide (TPR) repeat protein